MISADVASQSFAITDGVILILMLVISMCIGFYHGYANRKTLKTEAEYLMGGRNMSVVPVGMSILASTLSAIGLMGVQTEMYLYGSTFAFSFFPFLVTALVFNKYILPIFYSLNITSMYHYLEKRFDRRVRLFGSISFLILSTLYMPILLYVPSLSLNQVTGTNVNITSAILVSIVVLYTCVGGFRATVWTDVFQTVAMFGAIIVVLIKGTVEISDEMGFEGIFRSTYDRDRYEFPTFNIDPTIRHSFWSITFGGVGYCGYIFCNQNVVQRYLSLPSIEKVHRAAWLSVGIFVTIYFLSIYGGSLLLATFNDCDPKMAGLIREHDQLIPFFVLLISRNLPGLAGIFIGGMFCAALSSMSTFLNSMAAVVLEDFFKPLSRKDLSMRAKNWIMRGVVVVFGLLCVPLTAIAEKSNTIMQLTNSFEGVTSGSVLGIFILGIFFPTINGSCALVGGIAGLILMGWISFSAQTAIAAGDIVFETKPLSHEGCPDLFNITVNLNETSLEAERSYVFPLFRISYLFYIPLGIVTTVTVAFLMRYLTGGNKPGDVDATLISRLVHSRDTDVNEIARSQDIIEEKIDLMPKDERTLSRVKITK
ncbi:sodium-coupled monocarboxylate transporter 1-like [Phlebotomus argentipes]|uniref:sodium-coupled monocarboxylate transporter 1-like n=1 Tax=Phlebotomus argentipes TaxID=94469 RepID=UPI0028930688|nr:sodium-coupled monocarboxylate transporter 1-like [Phlebotomus argentipes]